MSKENSTFLITGGTGSFGMAAVKHLSEIEQAFPEDIKEIRVFSRDETKQNDMKLINPNKKIKYFIGDVRCSDSMYDAMRGVDYVFHSAALKAIPSCEKFPLQATLTNIIGTHNVLEVAHRAGVKKCVILSTDKAVYPVSAMGASKFMAEKIALSDYFFQNDMQVCITRFGNLAGSRGSVIPLFLNQMSRGEPMTLTDPNMTRFMMTIEEAVDLIMWAFLKGKNGHIYIKKSPAATMGDLVKAVQNIFNYYNTKIIGPRCGEKAYEGLITTEESVRTTEHDGYFVVAPDEYTERENGTPYFSNTSQQLSVKELEGFLMTVECVRKAKEVLNVAGIGRLEIL